MSELFAVDLEVALRMCAYGADIGSLGTYYDMAAIPALPYLYGTLLEYFLSLYILKERTISLFVMLLDSAYCPELSSQLGEALSLGSLCKIRILASGGIVSRRQQLQKGYLQWSRFR